MVKTTVNRSVIAKIAIFIILAVIAVVAIVILLVNKGSYAPSVADISHNGQLTIKGLAVCLPHRNTVSEQTLECAVGIRTEKGIYYSLSHMNADHDDSAIVITGKQYEVTGAIEERADSRYQTAGVIRVEKSKELQ